MKNVKKILLSVGVALVFIAYSFQQRHDTSGVVITPTTDKSNQNNSSTNSGSSNQSNNQSAAGSSSSSSSNQSTGYKDGSYTGDAADAFYGYIQVKAIIFGGKITDVQFLQYPNDRQNSIYINSQAMPYLKDEAIKAQSANVNIVTGATDTSNAFIQSLSSALNQAT